MRIVHCIWSFTTGGTENMLIDIASEQAKNHEVHIFIVNDDYEQRMIDSIPPSVHVHMLRRKHNLFSYLKLLQLNWQLLRLKPDAIHLQNVNLSNVVFPFTHRRKFMTVHAIGYNIVGVKSIARMAVISKAVKEDVNRRYGDICDVVVNGVNIENIKIRDNKTFTSQLKLLQVGRLDMKTKGQDILIQALGILVRKGIKDVTLTFIGDGDDLSALQALAEKEGVSDRVAFLGVRKKDYVYSHLGDYDLMVHPARWEGFGLTIAEAMVAQLPVAVPEGGGPYEVTDNGRLALTFAQNDPAACADAIAFAHDNYQSLLYKTAEAREYAIKNYSISRTASDYVNLYKRYI